MSATQHFQQEQQRSGSRGASPDRRQSPRPAGRRSESPRQSHSPRPPRFFIGVDVGTGSARACVVNHHGDILGQASEDIGLWEPKTDYKEQSTNNIWTCICKCVKRALSESGVGGGSVAGIGFDATCSLAVFDNETDKPISVTPPHFKGNDHNVILWLDHRPVEETERINATKHKLLKYVGGTMSIEMEIPKALWLKKNMPKELFSRCKFYDLADALTHMATGGEKRSFCSAVCKQGYVPVGVDGSVKGWQGDFLKQIGLEDLTQDNFKRIGGVDKVNGEYLYAGDPVGTLSKQAAMEMNLNTGCVVGSGVIDAYAGWIGTVGAKVPFDDQALRHDSPRSHQAQAYSRLAAVAGTSTCHLIMSQNPVFVKGVWGPYRDCLIPNAWMGEGGQSATGELLKHVLETHPAHKEATQAATAKKQNIYDFLNGHLKELQQKAKAPSVSYLGRHFFFYGDHFGNRSPIADPNMAGAVVGLSSDKSLDNLAIQYYGAMEFIALQTKQIVETMNKSGHKVSSIFMSGSQCQNDILMLLMATACAMPVVIPRYVHAAVVHGAAMLGARAYSGRDGQPEDLWAIMSRMSKPGKIVQPTDNKSVGELLQVKYKVFLELCERQKVFRKMVDDVTAGHGGRGAGRP